MNIKYVLLSVGVLLLVALGFFWLLGPEKGASGADSRETRQAFSRKTVKSGETTVKKGANQTGKTVRSGKAGSAAVAVAYSRPEDDERELNEMEKAVLKQINEALEGKNLYALRKAIAQFYAPAEKGGLEGRVPKELRLQAIEALGWFRPDTAADLLSFMADADEEVVEDAFTKFEMELDDSSLGDRERSEILVQVMKALTDSERIDSLLMNLNNMRNSVKVDTILKISETGSKQAQTLMKEQLGFFTEADVETVDGVKEWMSKNPDDATDEEFYGPSKDN